MPDGSSAEIFAKFEIAKSGMVKSGITKFGMVIFSAGICDTSRIAISVVVECLTKTCDSVSVNAYFHVKTIPTM